MSLIHDYNDLPAEIQNKLSNRLAIVDLKINKSHFAWIIKAIDALIPSNSKKNNAVQYRISRALASEALFISESGQEVRYRMLTDLRELVLEEEPETARKQLTRTISTLESLGIVNKTQLKNHTNEKYIWNVISFKSQEDLENLWINKSVESTHANERRSQGRDLAPINKATPINPKHDISFDRKYALPCIPNVDKLIPPVLWHVAHARDGNHNTSTKAEVVNNQTVVLKGHNKVFTHSSLKTALLLFNLAIAYNAKMLATRIFTRPFEEDRIPIYTKDILAFKASDSAPMRERVASDIDIVSNTTINIHDLTSQYCETEEADKFLKRDFRIIESVWTLSDKAYDIDNPDKQVKYSTQYFIRFSKEVQKILSEEKIFKALPIDLLNANVLLVTLYLHLRSTYTTKKIISLNEIKNNLGFSGTDVSLENRLIKQLMTKYMHLDKKKRNFESDDENYQFNLFGYYINFITIPVKGVGARAKTKLKHAMEIYCDERTMVTDSGASWNSRIGALNAPTVFNPISGYQTQNIELAESVKREDTIAMIESRYTRGKRSALPRRHLKLYLTAKPVIITHYTRKEDLKRCASFICTEIMKDVEVVLAALIHIQARLKAISYGDFTITVDEVERLKNHLANDKNLRISNEDIVLLTRSYRIKRLSQWKAGDYSQITPEIEKKYHELRP
ncbi:replication initiator protein RctB domain-containing protein [Vibrio sp. PNB22_3_1]